MKEFVGRTKELDQLERIWSEDRYKTCAIYGRRRIGKTSLFNKFIEGKRSIVLDLTMGTEKENVQRIGRILQRESDSFLVTETLYDVFQVLKTFCSEERTVVVIDEMPYLTANNREAASEIQHFVDWLVDNTDSMIIVCGSSISLMMENLKDRKGPLFGRFHHMIDLGPLTLEETRGFHPSMSDVDILSTYLTLGGVPMFHAGAGDRSYSDLVEEYLFDPSGIFYNDSVGIVINEMRSLSTESMSVLEAIAAGSCRFGEISSRTGLSDLTLTKCLKGLSGMRLIGELHPMAGAPKHPHYIITDAPTAFFFTVIRSNEGLIGSECGRYEAASQQISSFLGRQFEVFCRDVFPSKYPCTEIGSWWGAVPVRDEDGRIIRDGNGKAMTEDADIDLVATLRRGNNRVDLFAECKFTRRKASFTVLNNLEKRVDSLKGGHNPRLAIVSVYGFEEDLREYAEDKGIILIGLDNLIGKTPYPDID